MVEYYCSTQPLLLLISFSFGLPAVSDLLYPSVLNEDALRNIKQLQSSSVVKDINNYFVENKADRVDARLRYPVLFNEVKFLLGASPFTHYLSLISDNKDYAVDVYTEPLEEEGYINFIDYKKAYCLIQLYCDYTGRLARILINKKDKMSSMVVMLENCVFDNYRKHELLSADTGTSMSLASGLYAAPTGAYSYQYYLYHGKLPLDNSFKSRILAILN